jgi:D-arabinose 1-dehydrogenase-like Zn-dependent alcohol dehydrogenase
MTEVLDLSLDGQIVPVTYARVPWLEAHRAHDLVESGSVLGKIIWVMSSEE